MPRRLSEAIRKLESHEFEDAQARADFEALLKEYENIRDLENFRERNQHLFHGPKSLNYQQALELMREMDRMKQLEQDLMSGNFDNISMDDLREMLGQQADAGFPEPAPGDAAARRRRLHGAEGRAHGALAQGRAAHRPAGAARHLPGPAQGPRRIACDRPSRDNRDPSRRDQELQLRRSAQLEPGRDPQARADAAARRAA